jgi:hypothetical protein
VQRFVRRRRSCRCLKVDDSWAIPIIDNQVHDAEQRDTENDNSATRMTPLPKSAFERLNYGDCRVT